MNYTARLKPLFHPGKLLITPAAIGVLRAHGIPAISLVLRHICGDWGNISSDDWKQNDLSVPAGLRLLSCYRLSGSLTVWAMTEWNRSYTTIFLPDEY